MAKNKDRDSYKKLIRVLLVLLVLLVLIITAYILVDKFVKGEFERQTLAVKKQNEERIAEYQAALAEQKEQDNAVQTASWPIPAETGWDVVDLSAFAVERGKSVSASRKEMILGGLLLLNRWHELPSDFSEEELVSVGKTTSYRVPVTDSNVRLFPAAVTSLDTMLTEAKAAGQEFYIIREGYRSMETQTAYWQTRIEALQSKYSGDALTEEARKSVSYPGTSEFQSGMSFKIDVYNKDDSTLNAKEFQTTSQAAWLNENAWRYGFIFRYPIQNYPYPTTTDKSFKTSINIKMDVYRYVGIPHAAIMNVLDLCFEEYIEYLIAHPHIAVYEDGKLKFEVFRQAGGVNDANISIPASAASYVITADNMGGLVCSLVY